MVTGPNSSGSNPPGSNPLGPQDQRRDDSHDDTYDDRRGDEGPPQSKTSAALERWGESAGRGAAALWEKAGLYGAAARRGAHRLWRRMRLQARRLTSTAAFTRPDWMRFEKPGRRRRSALLAVALVVAGPILAIATYATLSTSNQALIDSTWFKLLLLADFVYLVALIGLIGVRIARLMTARRERAAGSRLHARMAAVFGGVAAAPTILVAVFFFWVVYLSFEAWFSQQVSGLVKNVQVVARDNLYQSRRSMQSQTVALARLLAAGAGELPEGARDRRFPALVSQMSEIAPFAHFYVIDSNGEMIVRQPFSLPWRYEAPTEEEFATARAGAVSVSEGEQNDTMRALVRLESDAYLYVTDYVNPTVLRSTEEINQDVLRYYRLEENRGLWLAQFSALYLGFAVLVLLAAVYLGLWFAERLARPIARLSEAAQRVGRGDLSARVKEERGEDDLALLSRAFNKMTDEVRRKQEALTAANQQSEARRQFSEAVVLGVPAGVVGLDAERRVQVMNSAAAQLLGLDAETALGKRFAHLAPEFDGLLSDAAYEPSGVERQVRLSRNDMEHELLARATSQHAGATPEAVSGFVLTIDDLTDLNSAQRLAAWGDVARRVAHEIKNPLTPIQLAAERLRRKYAGRLGEDSEAFERYIETIVRQTADIGRMVDAFARFAKMPTPKMAEEKLDALLSEAVLLQKEGRAHIAYSLEIEDNAAGWGIRCDRGQLIQALTNLLTNASDAIQGRLQEDAAAGREPAPPEIRVRLSAKARRATILIEDNGVGLPIKDRRRLLEPYVTTREKGTGLGLAIVSKILEEHEGALELGDAQPFGENARPGACVKMTLPLEPAEEREPQGPKADPRKTEAEETEEEANGERLAS